jgi:hypothetical protein
MDFTRRHSEARTAKLAYRNANYIRGPMTEICDGVATHSEMAMSKKVPLPNEMLPIDNDDHTLEVDTRWMLMERPELKALMEADDKDINDEEASIYDDPRLADALTATQVLELLNVGK